VIVTLSLIGGFFLSGLIVTYILWDKINIKYLQYSVVGLIATLPFERIPSLDVGPATIRVSQLIFLFCVYLIVILIIKQDKELRKVKFGALPFFSLIFIALTIPSWFFVIDANRFWVTSIATWISFGIAVIISQFLYHRIVAFYALLIGMFVSGIFGIYQFLGDMIGLPITLTGLRDQYTKIVFGFPRIHSTALEPLYFAGMLFIPIIAFTLLVLADRSIIKKYPKWLVNIGGLYGFLLIFFLAFSKGAIAILAFILCILVLFWTFKNRSIKSLVRLASIAILPLIGVYGYLVTQPQTPEFVDSILFHIEETIEGRSATVIQRSLFVDSAIELLPNYIISGSGSGQYGVIASPLLKSIPFQDSGSYLIVNNVYLEIWIEFGLMALVAFVMIFFYFLYRGFETILKIKDWRKIEVIILITLTFTLLAYIIQWLTFSPIYITPIFIVLGFLDSMLHSNYIIEHSRSLTQTKKSTFANDDMINNLDTN
jgi:O-antigen ligase